MGRKYFGNLGGRGHTLGFIEMPFEMGFKYGVRVHWRD